MNRPSNPAARALLTILLLLALLLGSAALLLGAVATLFALSPGTDMHDANALIRVGPLYAVGGVAGLSFTRWLWRTTRRPPSDER